MNTFEIEGGYKLKGEITPQGAKNEALQIICATLLTSDEIVIENIPQIRDVINLINLLSSIGVKVKKINESTYSFKTENLDFDYLYSDEYKKKASSLRGSIMIVGPMLSRFGVGLIPRPGGDKIGRRRLDTHFIGFEKLGAIFNYDSSLNFYEVKEPICFSTKPRLLEQQT